MGIRKKSTITPGDVSDSGRCHDWKYWKLTNSDYVDSEKAFAVSTLINHLDVI